MTAAAVVLIRREREIVAAFRELRAVSPQTARSLDAVGVHEGVAFRRLRERAILCEAPGGGRYYLDEPRWQAIRQARRRNALVIGLVAAVVLTGWALGTVL